MEEVSELSEGAEKSPGAQREDTVVAWSLLIEDMEVLLQQSSLGARSLHATKVPALARSSSPERPEVFTSCPAGWRDYRRPHHKAVGWEGNERRGLEPENS